LRFVDKSQFAVPDHATVANASTLQTNKIKKKKKKKNNNKKKPKKKKKKKKKKNKKTTRKN